MYSSPSALKTSGRIELAIKRSSWSPAKWVHTKCQVGDWVTFRSVQPATRQRLIECSGLVETSTTRPQTSGRHTLSSSSPEEWGSTLSRVSSVTPRSWCPPGPVAGPAR